MSNLRKHLLTQHPFKYKTRASSKKQGTLESFSKPRHWSEAQAKDITDQIVSMLALHLRSVYMVECEGLKDLVACLQPGYTVPSRKLVMSMIHQKHEVHKEPVQCVCSTNFLCTVYTDKPQRFSTLKSYVNEDSKEKLPSSQP